MKDSCYEQCFNDRRGCCHCYTTDYMKNYSDNDFLFCPATHCTIESCVEFCDGETGNIDNYTSDNCCNSIYDPCCHDCALFFCPLALVIDIITFPFRSIKYNSCNCCNSKLKVIISEQIKPDIPVLEIDVETQA
jgi:hypothetical protein